MLIPEGVGTAAEFGGESGKGVLRKFFETRPNGEEVGESGHSPLRVVGGTDAGESPREGSGVCLLYTSPSPRDRG